MKNISILIVSCAVLVLIGCASQQDARSGLSTVITGLVRDQSGAEIPGVNVELRSAGDNGFLQTTLTNKSGEFAFANMPTGAYRLTFTLNGFQTVTRDASANTEKFSRLEIALPLLPEASR